MSYIPDSLGSVIFFVNGLYCKDMPSAVVSVAQFGTISEYVTVTSCDYSVALGPQLSGHQLCFMLTSSTVCCPE